MNQYIMNKETGKIELYFEKQDYLALPDEQKRDIHSNFLFSKKKNAWVSRAKFPNLYRAAFEHCFLVKFFEGYAFMVEIEFQKLHFVFAIRTFQRIVAEGGKNGSAPLVKAAVYRMFAFGYGTVEFGIQSPKEVYEYLTKHIHGQRDACRAAAMLLYNHSNGRRRNILFAGPTGCGKTEIWRVCRQLYSNIIIVDASRITAEGWTGSFKIHDIFTGLTASEIEKSIVVLDEFDKLCEPKYSSGGNNYSYLEQNNLLTLIEGGQITFPAENGKPAIAFDSSRLSFVFLGSFEILTEKKTVKKSESTIGFHAAPQKPDAYHMYTQKITQDDLIQYAGMRREIAGRINQIVQLGPMTAQDYEVILHDEEISPIF